MHRGTPSQPAVMRRDKIFTSLYHAVPGKPKIVRSFRERCTLLLYVCLLSRPAPSRRLGIVHSQPVDDGTSHSTLRGRATRLRYRRLCYFRRAGLSSPTEKKHLRPQCGEIYLLFRFDENQGETVKKRRDAALFFSSKLSRSF